MSGNVYDLLAPYYVEYARTRALYCDGVDHLVRAWLPPRVDTMLDVGSGDGGRAVRLAASVDAPRLVLSDPSEPMVRQCRIHPQAEVWCCAAEDLPDGPAEFDVITCLWNVLGSIKGSRRRIQALQRMRSRLSPGGRLFVDVHNRHNVATAGIVRVAGRIVRDMLWPSDSNGVVSFQWTVEGRHIPADGYLFTAGELGRLLAESGLRVVAQGFVDYTDGRRRGPWTGQMVYAAEDGRV